MTRSKYKPTLTQDILVSYTYRHNGVSDVDSVEMSVKFGVTALEIAEYICKAYMYDSVEVVSWSACEINLGQVLYGEI